VKVRLCSSRSFFRVGAGLLALVVGGGVAEVAGAQTPRVPDKDATPVLVVPAFTSVDKLLGCKSAQEVRARLDDDLNWHKLPVVSQTNVEETLKASGFPICDPITGSDAKQLASQLRADVIVDGTAAKTPTGVVINSKMVLARDVSFAQPLPPAEGKSPGDAARLVSKSVDAALKQLPGETQCYNLGRDQKYADALAAGRAAVVAYPQSTLARLCIANIYQAQKAPPDSIIAVTTQILQIDPHNERALDLSAQAHYDKKDYDNAVRAWAELIAADPSNTERVEDIVGKMVTSNHADKALPIMDTVVKANPGDPKLEELDYRLLMVTKHFKTADSLGDIIAKEDTAFADTLFFQRQIAAEISDSDFAKAGATASRGVAKFPNNATLQVQQIQLMLQNGQAAQAKAALQAFLPKNPKNGDAWAFMARAYNDGGQPDSVLYALHQAVAADTGQRKFATAFALSQGNTWYKRGSGSKNVDTLDVAIKFLTFSDSLSASPTAKFLLGAAAYTAGVTLDQDAVKEKSCPKIKQAQDYWNTAQANVPAGLQSYPEPAKQILTVLQQYLPIVAKQVKAICK
jgi:tetratricopeptide (TPR) repeat protein